MNQLPHPAGILFIDIETAPLFPSFEYLPERWKKLWVKKTEQKKRTETPEEYYGSAGIYAEFGKVICISCAMLHRGTSTFRTRTFSGDDEPALLSSFSTLLTEHYTGAQHTLCAHNGREFDFPFLARRMSIHGLGLPSLLDMAGRKPWETRLLDTMELWRFGDYKSYTSVDLLAASLNIPTPKEDIDGSMVHELYWKHRDLERISRYCEKDVVTVGKIYEKL